MNKQDMVEIRWHGRGGQGAKTACLLLADAAFSSGKYVQGFPEYGPERSGAPITAYNRISTQRCSIHSNIYEPDYVVVLYEEGLDQDVLEGAIHAIAAADVLIVGGTSLTVYPAAGLIRYYRGNKLVLINRDETPYDREADLVIRDPIGAVFAQI